MTLFLYLSVFVSMFFVFIVCLSVSGALYKHTFV
jgi:hypothetical protein